jgi:urease accessory protein
MPSSAHRAASLLLLADSRFACGAPAPEVRTLDELRRFLASRLRTTGLVAAAVAAAAAGDTIALADLDVITSARLPSSTARQASRRLGRQLLRVAATTWPSPVYRRLSRLPHHAVALGLVARVSGRRPIEAAVAAAFGSVRDPAGAAVRDLGLDALAVQAVLVGLAPRIDRVAAVAAAAAEQGWIPAPAPWPTSTSRSDPRQHLGTVS